MRDVYIFDVDGTLALKGDRLPYDWSRVGDDAPNEPVVALAQTLLAADQHLLYVSGRSDACAKTTREWLHKHVHCVADEFGYWDLFEGLFMRLDGDFRPDTVVKREIYENLIRPKYNVLGVFDDRDGVVKMWRELGLTCFQVAEGAF